MGWKALFFMGWKATCFHFGEKTFSKQILQT